MHFELQTVALPWADDDGEPINSAVLAPSDFEAGPSPGKGRPPLSPRDVQALDVLRELSTHAAASVGDWRKACEQRGIVQGKTPEAREKTMARIKAVLIDAGLVEPGIGRGIYLPSKAGIHADD
jgi:hypothetical protein